MTNAWIYAALAVLEERDVRAYRALVCTNAADMIRLGDVLPRDVRALVVRAGEPSVASIVHVIRRARDDSARVRSMLAALVPAIIERVDVAGSYTRDDVAEVRRSIRPYRMPRDVETHMWRPGTPPASLSVTPRVVDVRRAALGEPLVEWLARDPRHTYIGRDVRFVAGAERSSKWANPYPLSRFAREESLRRYEAYVRSTPALLAAVPELVGHTLGCWCAPQPCHGDVLRRLVDEYIASTTDGK